MSAVDSIGDVSAVDGPYVGLNFYTQENAAMFFGRDTERTVLISNLRASRLTLLYARSGAGKSSLLRAGVAARLAELAQRSLNQRGAARNIPVVFSSWRDDPTVELIGEIREAISPFLLAALPPTPTPDRLEVAIEAASTATDAALLVILDQFEEYLLYRPGKVRERPFADELAACINRADLRANFLISIREDAYFALGDLFKGRISNVYGNYFHLEHLTREAAREAIEKPVASFNELHVGQAPVQIEPGLVDAVLDQFRPDQLAPGQGGVGRLAEGNGAEPHRDEVEASYLQLVMKRLWDVEQEKRSRKLRLHTLEDLGGAQEIVRTHVDRALGDLPDEQAAVAILHHLVTPSGTKIALAASDLAEYTGRPADETNALLQRLAGSDTRILRPVPPPPGRTDGTRFEISHDLLAPAIQDWGRRRRAARLEHEKEAAERQAQAEKRRASRFRALFILAALVVVATTLAIILTPTSAPAAVTLEPVGTAGANPFMPPVGTDQTGLRRLPGGGGLFSGGTPGLYGGTLGKASCNPQQLVSFLHTHPGKAAAWAGVFGIRPADIPGYVAGLTSAVLRSDTAITNHGYIDGHITSFPAVLEAGTAVLIDRYGQPVTKCFCGNPLTKPMAYTQATYTGKRWQSFSATSVTYIQKTTTPENSFTLVNPVTGTAFQRPSGSSGSADKRVYLANGVSGGLG